MCSMPQPSVMGIEESSNVVEQSDPPHHVPEDDELDREWRCQGPSNYLNYSFYPLPSLIDRTIFRAPSNMTDCDKKAYAPTVVTIGPFHFGTGGVPLPQLRKHKSDCVSYLLVRHGSDEKAAELLKECMALVVSLEPDARSCYSVDVEHVHKHKFTEMLLQDGCFILRLLLKQQNEEIVYIWYTDPTTKVERWERELTVAPMVGRLWFWNEVMYDLLKLENQIPFFVVQRLFDVLETPADKGIDLVELALELLSGIYPKRAETFRPPPSSEVLHLLHLFHSSLIPPKLEDTTVTKAADWNPSTMVTERQHWIPSATVLRDAGIKFRPSNKESFLDVTFENGVMKIPPLQVDEYTSMVFRNLIAFEQCYLKTTTHITAYARFMDDLINTTNDVRLLSLDGVLLNRLGSEEAAADLFNKLCDQVHYIPERNYLLQVISHVNKYYETRWHKWCATLFHTYFSNPWVIISVLAACVLLLLTIEQAAFAGLSYLRPPS